MWSQIWQWLAGLGKSGAVSQAAPAAATATQAAPVATQGGFFQNAGNYLNSNAGRADVASAVQQQGQQAAATSAGAGQQAASTGMQFANAGGQTPMQMGSNNGTMMTSTYDPDRMKRIMAFGRG